jgi:Fe-S oxidoreductase
VRPVVNLKTEEGVRKFEAIANDVADLVLEFGGALSGEHGDGLVRSPFMRKMFGPASTRRSGHQADVRSRGHLQPRQDRRRAAAHREPALRRRLRDAGAGDLLRLLRLRRLGGAVEMCSGLGACRKTTRRDDVPVVHGDARRATRTRGRANVLRLAMAGRLGEAGLGDEGVYDVLDLCLECRACKAECPVGVDMARFKSEFLADYWSRHGTAHARVLGRAHAGEVGQPFRAGVTNWLMQRTRPARRLNERWLGIDRRRACPAFAHTRQLTAGAALCRQSPDVLLFNDTFTNYYDPEIGIARSTCSKRRAEAGLARNTCCGRPQISKGLLAEARDQALRKRRRCCIRTPQGRKFRVLRAELPVGRARGCPGAAARRGAPEGEAVAGACVLFEEYLAAAWTPLPLSRDRRGFCSTATAIRRRWGSCPARRRCSGGFPGAAVVDLDAGCCGMAGSFGYAREHYEVSRKIGERAAPAVRERAGRCRGRGHVLPPPGERLHRRGALHPAVLLQSLPRTTHEPRWLSLGALFLAILVSCVHPAERRHSIDGAGLDHRRLPRRHERSTRSSPASRCSSSSRWPA